MSARSVRKFFSPPSRASRAASTGGLRPITSLKGRHFLSTADLTPDELSQLLDLALAAKRQGPGSLGQPLTGKGVGLVFFNPSLRTRVSMTMAIHQLGGLAVPLEIGAGTWDLETVDGAVMNGSKPEHVREALPVLSQYVSAIGVRCFPGLKDLADDRTEPVLSAFARHAQVPVINLESAMGHPCQALADMMTIRERLGQVAGKKLSLVWANHPKPLPHAVPTSFALAAVQCGARLTIAAPKAYQPDWVVMAHLEGLARTTGAQIAVTDDQQAAFDGAEIIYAKSWASTEFYGQPERDLNLRRDLAGWCVTPELMARTSDAAFMHCLPVRRNVVVADAVLDSPASIVVEQAANRLHAQKALLACLLGEGL